MRRMLAVLGDFYHCSDQLLGLVSSTDLPDDLEITVVRYPQPFEPASLVGYDLLLLAAIGRLRPKESDEHWMTGEVEQALADHVAAGAGLLLLHAGTASHPTDGAFRALAGGHFLQHPPEHPPVTITPVAGHPITEGVASFTHPDEHYFLDVDDGVTQLLTATSELGEQSGGWCRTHGSGRVAALVPGHTREMLTEPMMRRLLANAVGWCLGDTAS